MSLINKMLQDLDARQGDCRVGTVMSGDVRPLPKLQRSRYPWLWAAGIVFLFAGGTANYFIAGQKIAAATRNVAAEAPKALQASDATLGQTVRGAKPEMAEREFKQDVEQKTGPNLRLSLRLSDIAVPQEFEVAAEPPVVSLQATAKPQVENPRVPKVAAAKAKPAPSPSLNAQSERLESAKQATVAAIHPEERGVIEKTAPAMSDTDRVEAAYRRAAVVAGEGRINEAIGALQQLLRQDGLHVGSRQLLARLLIDNGRQSEAIQVLQEGLQAQPARIAWVMTLARLQIEQGSLETAAETLRFSQSAAASSPDYLGFAAHVEQRLGHHGEAASLYEKAARLAPNDGRWWLGLGLALEADGLNDQAAEAFERASRSGNLRGELRALVERKSR